ncbi:hypothetical protein EV663_101239 [Rhodovulum bhavnagarense]|uniref:YmgG-like glycine-zipper protein n=1 Tax=Rhodovulum bhavnagarense TaxID=992286 RepID=A0A4V2SWL8_9RHOB|nr:hypothetical protein [Rhodovulum bhavnagarense]TCP62976.1 hypothetical protein EV663_101239 [Rhodovulum bhavnagarense]
MGYFKAIGAVCALALLGGCMSNDGERALAGAAAGAVVADVLDESALVGAAVGAAVGATCDDMGVCN